MRTATLSSTLSVTKQRIVYRSTIAAKNAEAYKSGYYLSDIIVDAVVFEDAPADVIGINRGSAGGMRISCEQARLLAAELIAAADAAEGGAA